MKAMDFAKLVENAKKVDSFSNSKNKEPKEQDPRFLVIKRDEKTGNAVVVVRFLHNEEKNEMPFIKRINHRNEEFKNDKKHYLISECPTEIGEKCPICEYNKENWGSYSKNQQGRQRKNRYITNVLVVEDPIHPERVGKVFLYSYGFTLHNMIMNKIAPDTKADPTAKAINIYDYMKGKNFKLRVTTKGGNACYDTSEWDETEPLFEGNEKKILEVNNQIYSLEEFTAKKEGFKTYDEVKTKFNRFLHYLEGKSSGSTSNRVEDNGKNDGWESAVEKGTEKTTEDVGTTAKAPAKSVPEATTEDKFFDFD